MTTIAYDRPVKDMISRLNETGHVTHNSYTKTSITFHHNAARLSHEGVLSVWKVRPASAHFDVDGHGELAQYVKALEYAWAAGNTIGNMRSIHIEMANETLGPEWRVAEVTWKSAARLGGWLLAKVIKKAPSRSTVRLHHDWSATACPGPYIDKIYNRLLDEVTKWYNYFKGQVKPPKPKPPAKPSKVDRALTKRIQEALEVTADGLWGNTTDEWAMRMRAAARAHRGYPKNVPVAFREDLVQRVIDTTPDNIWGPKSQAALIKWIKEFQRILGVPADGWWGPNTDTTFLTVRKNNRNKF